MKQLKKYTGTWWVKTELRRREKFMDDIRNEFMGVWTK